MLDITMITDVFIWQINDLAWINLHVTIFIKKNLHVTIACCANDISPFCRLMKLCRTHKKQI
jgi:hypothetical protein